MNYRSVADLNRSIVTWMPTLPGDFDLIVGVPRSGLLAANILALHRNLPLTDIEGLIKGRIFESGDRLSGLNRHDVLSLKRKVLVLDDSLFSGKQMAAIKRQIGEARLPHEIHYAAVYIAPNTEGLVDHHREVVPMPRFFEWNLMHHRNLEQCCMDIDGVLCADPSPEENDDGPEYKRFLQNALPLMIPSTRVGWLVTCRLEKYRALTEQWLARQRVQYTKLVMLNLQSKEERVTANCHARFKADVYKRTEATLFIESSMGQALEIARIAGKPVCCMETHELIQPERLAQLRAFTANLPKRLREGLLTKWRAKLIVVKNALWKSGLLERS